MLCQTFHVAISEAVSIPARGVGLVTNVGEVSVLFVTSKLAYYHNDRVVIDV